MYIKWKKGVEKSVKKHISHLSFYFFAECTHGPKILVMGQSIVSFWKEEKIRKK
jgi:hypothetical protein